MSHVAGGVMRLAGRRLWCVVAYVYAFPGECVARSFEAAWISGLRSGALHGVQHFRPTKVCVGEDESQTRL